MKHILITADTGCAYQPDRFAQKTAERYCCNSLGFSQIKIKLIGLDEFTQYSHNWTNIFYDFLL